MTNITIDYENNGDEFWDAARTLDPRTWQERYRDAAQAIRTLARSDDDFAVIETRATPAQVVAVAETLPDWTGESPHAAHPILIDATVPGD